MDTTTDLLMKARKGATASFGTKQWTIVLEALGLKVTTTKEGRQVVRADITAPGGATLTIHKEPHYKWIVFYQLGPWLKDQGINLPVLASKALGMETPDEEKRLKSLYERDLTNTGTCGVCNGNFKREADGTLHMHGFTRPGDGYLHGRCFGVGYQPHEISVDAARDYLEEQLRPFLARATDALRLLEEDKVDSFMVEVHQYGKPKTHRKVTRVDAYEFKQERERAIYKAKATVEWVTRDVAMFEERVGDWKPDDLPEVKYAHLIKR